jgi:uncharacterized protein YhbP (UPF0306 family)
MPIERSVRPMASSRIAATARRLLEASALCAVATAGPGGRPHINTVYFAWSHPFDIVWLSDPDARHSRNLRANAATAIAVYDSNQSWGRPDRGIQLFGTARALAGRAAGDAELVYARRFRAYVREAVGAYRFYRFRPRRIKLFDEAGLGPGVFVTATVGRGQPAWERTEVYRASAPPAGKMIGFAPTSRRGV